jgi:hypothetical protein
MGPGVIPFPSWPKMGAPLLPYPPASEVCDAAARLAAIAGEYNAALAARSSPGPAGQVDRLLQHQYFRQEDCARRPWQVRRFVWRCLGLLFSSYSAM